MCQESFGNILAKVNLGQISRKCVRTNAVFEVMRQMESAIKIRFYRRFHLFFRVLSEASRLDQFHKRNLAGAIKFPVRFSSQLF